MNVTCETCPQYFTLTDEAVKAYNTNAKMNPPLGSVADVAAIVEGLVDGTIDCIATDHAPHAAQDKETEYAVAANGIVGLETSLGLVMTHLAHTGVLAFSDAIRKMTAEPAKVLGLDAGDLAPADRRM